MAPSPRPRKSSGADVAAGALRLALGADIGGTNARVALVDQATGQLIHSAKVSLRERTPEGVAESVGALVDEVVATAAAGALSTQAPLGVGVAGMLEGHRVLNAPNLGWQNVDWGTLLSARVRRSVRLINDLSAAAWGEFCAGSATGVSDSLTVFVGTGVGSAIITCGALLHGASGVAGELGHIKVVLEGGRKCGCGQSGCLEAYIGGAKLEEWMREVGLHGNPAHLENLAAQGVKVARELYHFAVEQLGLAVANLVTVLNPAVVVLGGGVLSNCPGMVERVKQLVAQRATVAAATTARVTLAQLGDDAGLVGAALLGAAQVTAET